MSFCIQKAIDECSKKGGGRVVIQPGVYPIDSIQLKDDVVLYLEKGALLLGSSDITAYEENQECFVDAVGHKRGRALLYAYGCKNIGIEGEGVIDGRGRQFLKDHPNHFERPFLIRFVNCSHVEIGGVTFRQSASWCIHLQHCHKVQMDNVTIVNRCNDNNDGIDIDGCEDVIIQNCSVDSGDDGICLKTTSVHPCKRILIQNCRVTTRWAAFKIGTESVGDFEEIQVKHCYFYDVEGCGIKVVPVDGGSVRNLQISDIHMEHCTGPIFFSTGERLKSYFHTQKQKPGVIEQIMIEDVFADTVEAKGGIYQGQPWGNGKGGVVFSGLPQYPIQNLTIRNSHFVLPGGCKEKVDTISSQMGTRYPEFHLFDPLPGWGMNLRHIRGITLEEVSFEKKEEDVRTKIWKEDVCCHI